MPFTPFHMGPGILIKGLLQSSFSLMVFGWSQIVMDIQPLAVLLIGEGHLHGLSHTFVGASVLAIFSAFSGKYLSEIGLSLFGISKKSNPIRIIWWVAVVSAFVGTYSHVLLDSLMHADVQPFYPTTLQNNFLGLLSVAQIHKLCLYSGLAGAGAYYLVQFQNRKHKESK